MSDRSINIFCILPIITQALQINEHFRHVLLTVRSVWVAKWLALHVGSQVPRFEPQRRNTAHDCKALHCTEPFIVTLPSSPYDLNSVERDVKDGHYLYVQNVLTGQPAHLCRLICQHILHIPEYSFVLRQLN